MVFPWPEWCGMSGDYWVKRYLRPKARVFSVTYPDRGRMRSQFQFKIKMARKVKIVLI